MVKVFQVNVIVFNSFFFFNELYLYVLSHGIQSFIQQYRALNQSRYLNFKKEKENVLIELSAENLCSGVDSQSQGL